MVPLPTVAGRPSKGVITPTEGACMLVPQATPRSLSQTRLPPIAAKSWS
jgi:hypothetical protein